MTRKAKQTIAERKKALQAAAKTPRFPSVFISYSRKDKSVAKSLAEDLGSAGITVWWDREGVLPGDQFAAAILNAIDAADRVIVIWSDASATSAWVCDEARRAARQNKLITVHLPGFDAENIPFGFGGYHSESIEDRDRLIAALARYATAA
jgi:hypothetical protein